jgi:hypothetical protein
MFVVVTRRSGPPSLFELPALLQVTWHSSLYMNDYAIRHLGLSPEETVPSPRAGLTLSLMVWKGL